MNKFKSICTPKGFEASGIHAGIRKNKSKKDLGLIFCKTSADVLGVYTTNKVKGASIDVTKEHLTLNNGKSMALIVNSGNANTCNKNGYEVAVEMCTIVAKALGIKTSDVIIAQTGVIGEEMSLDPIKNGMNELKEGLSVDGGTNFATAIMTTDLIEKESVVEIPFGNTKGYIAAVAKGSGMINPKMATMLCFITTDINISNVLMEKAFKDVISNTLNMVSVDGDTSTNDMAMLFNSKLAGNSEIVDEKSIEYADFKNGLFKVLTDISKLIARDGEGATKLLIAKVTNAADEAQAQKVAKSVISSNLLKAAMFASDANWGRILCAIGYADCDVDVEKIDVSLESKNGVVQVCEKGYGEKFDNEFAHKVLDSDEVIIDINLNSGTSFANAYGCDLTYQYVKINAEYRT